MGFGYRKFISGAIFPLLAMFSWSGCAHETTLTNSDIRLYSGTAAIAGMLSVTSDSLVCASYNIKFSEEVEIALQDLDCSPYLQKPDILLLQEMEPEGVALLADRLGMNFEYYPSFIHPHHGRLFGNAVLSPWPLSHPQHLVLPHANPGTDNYRVALAVDVQVGERKVRAICVHLSTLVVDLDGRLEQAVAISDSLVPESGPTIIGGDFNSGTPMEEVLFRRVARKSGFREGRIPLERTADGGPLDLIGHKLRLDHFYYRDLDFITAGGCQTAQASDHFPVWSVYRWVK